MADESDDFVTLKCSNYQSIICKGLQRFFDEKLMVDIDVTCHGYTVRAHKLMMAIFCPLLRESMIETSKIAAVDDQGDLPPTNQSLKLDYVADHGSDMKYLIEFIYRGKVSLPKDRLQKLLETAESLGVEGLVESIRRVNFEFSQAAEDSSKMTAELPTESKRKGTSISRFMELEDESDYQESDDIAEMNDSNSDEDDDEDDALFSYPVTLDDDHSEFDRHCRFQSLSSYKTAENELESMSESTTPVDDREPSKVKMEHSSLPERLESVKARNDEKSDENFPKGEYRKQWRMMRPMLRCEFCSYETRDKSSFASHAAKHDPSAERFVCPVCSKTFRSKRGFRCHQRGHSSDPGQIYKCPHCEFHTPQKWSWLQHLAVIHQVDPDGNALLQNVKCSECDFVCVAEHQLKAHQIRKHTMDKPYKCSECHYSAVIKYELEKHVSIKHRNERPYMCDVCGFRSQTRSGFERHRRSHTGVKPFKCDVCGQVYADNRKLKSHRLRHINDEKPYVCKLCGHACRRRDNLQMHMKRIHKSNLGDSLLQQEQQHQQQLNNNTEQTENSEQEQAELASSVLRIIASQANVSNTDLVVTSESALVVLPSDMVTSNSPAEVAQEFIVFGNSGAAGERHENAQDCLHVSMPITHCSANNESMQISQ